MHRPAQRILSFSFSFSLQSRRFGVRTWISVSSHHSVHHMCRFNKRRGWGFWALELRESEPRSQSGRQPSPFAACPGATLPPRGTGVFYLGRGYHWLRRQHLISKEQAWMFFLHRREPSSRVYSTICHLQEKLGAYSHHRELNKDPIHCPWGNFWDKQYKSTKVYAADWGPVRATMPMEKDN